MSEVSANNAYYNHQFKSMMVTVLPGDFYTTGKSDEMIVTILGSCVAACIRDTQLGVGGLNHFLLAEEPTGVASYSNRYGSNAMEQLINSIIRQGGKRENLEIKVFGGANVMGAINSKVGFNNVEFVKSYIKKEGLKIASEDLGGTRPRRIHYWPCSGKVLRHLIQQQENQEQQIIKQEENYKTDLNKKKNQSSMYGTIELWG